MLFALAALLATQAPPSGPAFDAGQAMYGVVLIVTQLEDGYASYGSGIVVDKEGNVLTNLHVLDKARAVHALTFDPERPSYAATDGGLSRLVFERERDLIPVRIIRGDPILDLAIVRLEKPARVLPLPLATATPAVGTAVAALGHPEQNFWTITRGQVSGLHQGVIQHDAAVNKGNSGGPLLDPQGRVVGVNTSFIKGAQGISYARPAFLASKILASIQAPLVLDRSTPRKAVESCLRARELGDPAYSQCVNWGTHYTHFRDNVNEALAGSHGLLAALEDPSFPALMGGVDPTMRSKLRGGPKKRARDVVRTWLEKGDGRADVWVTKYGPFLLSFMLSDDPTEHGRAADDYFFYVQDASRGGRPPPGERRDSPRRREPKEKLLLDPGIDIDMDGDVREVRVQKGTGLKVALTDIGSVRKIMKMGVRVDDVREVAPDTAFAVLAGRNLDGSPYRYTVRLVKAPDGWREVDFPTAEDRARHRPPAGFPPELGLTTIPTVLALTIGVVPLTMFLWSDDAAGVNQDFDFEHVWPAFLESVKKRSSGTGARVAQTLEMALEVP